jgi:hypothetical protein
MVVNDKSIYRLIASLLREGSVGQNQDLYPYYVLIYNSDWDFARIPQERTLYGRGVYDSKSKACLGLTSPRDFTGNEVFLKNTGIPGVIINAEVETNWWKPKQKYL